LRDVPNPRDYFSGHKKDYGINVQGVCDARRRILVATFNTPGIERESCVWVVGWCAFICIGFMMTAMSMWSQVASMTTKR
jgi:hypothetical protein